MVQACVRLGFSIWRIRTLWINVNDSKTLHAMGKILARNTIQPPNISIKYQMKLLFLLLLYLTFCRWRALFRLLLLFEMFWSFLYNDAFFLWIECWILDVCALSWRMESHKFDLFIKSRSQTFNFNMNEHFILFFSEEEYCGPALVEFPFRLRIHARMLLCSWPSCGNQYTHTHITAKIFEVIQNHFATIHMNNGEAKRKTWPSISFPQWFLRLHLAQWKLQFFRKWLSSTVCLFELEHCVLDLYRFIVKMYGNVLLSLHSLHCFFLVWNINFFLLFHMNNFSEPRSLSLSHDRLRIPYTLYLNWKHSTETHDFQIVYVKKPEHFLAVSSFSVWQQRRWH